MRNVCAVAWLIAVGWAAAAQVVEVPLKYMKIPERAEIYYPAGGTGVELTKKPEEKPLVVPDVPKYAFRYGSFKVGDTEFKLALARSIQGKQCKYRLYVDTNQDGSAVDETPISVDAEVQDTWMYAEFPPLDIKYAVNGKTFPFSVRFSLSEEKPSIRSGGYSSLYISSAAVYTADLTLGGVKYSLVIGDCEFNGRFDDKLTIERQDDYVYGRGDAIMLTTAGEKSDYYDGVFLTEFLMIGDDLYRVAVDFADTKLTVAKADVALAPMKIPTEVRRLEIASNDGKGWSIAFLNPGPVVQIPAGSYQLVKYLLSRTEPVGDVWVLAADATPRTPACTVEAGNAAEMAFGEPFSVQLTQQRLHQMMMNDKKTYRLEMGAEGRAFERVATVMHKSGDKTKFALSERNHRSPKEPTYKIVTAEGEKLAEGNFEYG